MNTWASMVSGVTMRPLRVDQGMTETALRWAGSARYVRGSFHPSGKT